MKNLNYLLVLFLISIISISDFTTASVPEGISLTKSSNGYVIDFTLPAYKLLKCNTEELNTLIRIPGYGVMPDKVACTSNNFF
jgi:hypothetical protein